jgi:DNA-directed RNA polymerase beta subunit
MCADSNKRSKRKLDSLNDFNESDKKNVLKNRRIVSKSLMFDLNLNDHHTQPFDECLRTWLKDIVLNHGNIESVFKDKMYLLTVSNYRFIRGNMLPSDAHAYNVSYSGVIMVDIRELIICKKPTDVLSDNLEFPYVSSDMMHEDMPICSFPTMLYSSGCHFSDGYDLSSQTEPEYAGGFIVKGKRRYIPLLKSLVNNYPFRFFNKNKNTYTIQVRSEHLDRKHRSTSTLEIIIDADKSKRSTVYHNIYVKIPFLTPSVPITIIVLALGWSIEYFEECVQSSVGQYWDALLFRKYLIMFRHDHHGCVSQDDALQYIGRLYGKLNNTSTAEHVMKSEVLPHLNDFHSTLCKGYYLAYLFGLLVLFKEDVIKATDRDSRMYTRLIDSGTSLAFLFRMLYLTFIKQGLKIMRRVLNQEKDINVCKIYNHNRLTQKLMSALATGTWSKKRKGVSHQMITTNEQAMISQLRRISSSYLNNDGKHLGPRMVHESACGYECAAETPEGKFFLFTNFHLICFLFRMFVLFR